MSKPRNIGGKASLIRNSRSNLRVGWVMMSSTDAVPAKRRNSELRLRKRATRRCASVRPVEQEADVKGSVKLSLEAPQSRVSFGG